MTGGEKALLTVLSVIIALGLLALVGSLACNLSCSGSDGAAGIGGIGRHGGSNNPADTGVARIYGKKKKKLQPDQPSSTGG